MNRRMIALGMAILVVAFASYGTWLWAGSRDDGRSPASLGGESSASETAGEGTSGAGEGGSTGSAESSAAAGPEDAVPMEIVDELFTSLDEMGLKPSMNETFTVEYVGSFERVRVVGAFEGEGTRTVEFALSEDEAWEIVVGGR